MIKKIEVAHVSSNGLDPIDLIQFFGQEVIMLEKWFPLQGERGNSSYFWSFQKHNREEGGQNENNRSINLPKVITFSTDYKCTT